MESKKEFLLSAISSINQNLKSLCEYNPVGYKKSIRINHSLFSFQWNKDCYSIIDRSTLDANEKLKGLNSQTVCTSGQSLENAVCIPNTPFEKLCKQLVQSDENSLRMESLFKSMFNQNGHVEKELCELDQSLDCKPSSFKLDNCKDKCDCCVQFYTTKKTYDLNMIVCIRKIRGKIWIIFVILGNIKKRIFSHL
jgi:hypothetical protein